MAYQRKKRSQEQIQKSPAPTAHNSLFATPALDMDDTENSLSDGLAKDSPTLEERRKMASRSSFDFGSIPLFPKGATEISGPPRSPLVQAKLTVGPVGDAYEQEADRVAAQVVETINRPEAKSPVQRRIGAPAEGDDALQRKPVVNIQRMCHDCEEDLQKQPDMPRVGEAGGAVSPDLEAQIQSAKGGGHALAPGLQQRMGEAMGADFSTVKVHADSQADRLNQSIQAKAFTTGSDIFFRQGAYKPDSKGGQGLIAHELTHVVQQNGGSVQRTHQIPTREGQDGNAKTSIPFVRPGKHNEQGERTADGRESSEEVRDESKTGELIIKGNAGDNAIIQRKGNVALMTQVKKIEGVAEWNRKINMPKIFGGNPTLKQLFDAMKSYDATETENPSEHLTAVEDMLRLMEKYVKETSKKLAQTGREMRPNDVLENRRQTWLNAILEGERERNAYQVQYESNPSVRRTDAPYNRMTEKGMLWNLDEFEHNTANIEETGKAYFKRLSERNMAAMNKERGNTERGEWYNEFVTAAKKALNAAVLNHYTTAEKAQAMLASGGMKSKMKLEEENPKAAHNTNTLLYDEYVLGNSGFLFFFIESQNAPMRETRFAKEEGKETTPARISIPLNESGLTDHGWVMLTDFAQREFPIINTTAENEGYEAYLATRDEQHQEQYTTPVRKFEAGVGTLEEGHVEEMGRIEESDKRQAYSLAIPQAMGDPESKMHYMRPQQEGPAISVEERLLNNVLFGPDIIDGLATRAALEVARIKTVNQRLGDEMSQKRDDELIQLILRKFFRPQAMLPTSMEINPAWVKT